jgi:hypothetical protein
LKIFAPDVSGEEKSFIMLKTSSTTAQTSTLTTTTKKKNLIEKLILVNEASFFKLKSDKRHPTNFIDNKKTVKKLNESDLKKRKAKKTVFKL